MGQQKLINSTSRERLIVAFVLVSSLLVMADVWGNLADEIRITSELKTRSTKQAQQQSKTESTLSDEEMREWTERLRKHSDT